MHRKLKIVVSVLAITVVIVVILKSCVRGQVKSAIKQDRFERTEQISD